MGGRSRINTNNDRWSWVQELSDSRLQAYGRMSIASYRKGDNTSRDNRQSLNYWLSREYENRYGGQPGWAIQK